MQRFLYASASLLTLMGLTHAAQAGPIDPSAGLSGDVRIGVLDPRDGDRFDYYDFDMTARILLTPFFGVELGYEGLGEFNDDRTDRYTAYAFYNITETSYIGAGYIPSPIDALTDRDRIGYAAPIELELSGLLTSSAPRILSFGEDEPPLGLLYDADYGAVWASASVHFSPSNDGQIYSLATTYSSQLANGYDYTVGGGLEVTNSDTSDNLFRYFGMASLDTGPFDASLVVTGGDSLFGSGEMTVIDASVGYTPDIPPLAASFSGEVAFGVEYSLARRPGAASDLSLYGIGMDVTFEDQFGVNLSAGRSDSSGGGFSNDWVSFEAFLVF